MSSIGANAFGAQLEQRVLGSCSHASIEAMAGSSSDSSTAGSGWTVRLGAIVMGSRKAGSRFKVEG